MLTWRVFILHDPCIPCHHLLLRTPPFLDDTVGKSRVTKKVKKRKKKRKKKKEKKRGPVEYFRNHLLT
jgi:hypothetical protein